MREHDPASAGRSCQPVLDPWLVRERHEWLRVGEEPAGRGIALQQATPDFVRRSRHPLLQKEPRARNAVVEPARVHPTFIYNVWDRRPIAGVWAPARTPP